MSACHRQDAFLRRIGICRFKPDPASSVDLVVRTNPENLMRWPFLLFLLFLLGSVLSLVLIDRFATSRTEIGPSEAVQPRNPLFPAPTRS